MTTVVIRLSPDRLKMSAKESLKQPAGRPCRHRRGCIERFSLHRARRAPADGLPIKTAAARIGSGFPRFDDIASSTRYRMGAVVSRLTAVWRQYSG